MPPDRSQDHVVGFTLSVRTARGRAFSGKDPTKVMTLCCLCRAYCRRTSYARSQRNAAIQLSYAIGVIKALSIYSTPMRRRHDVGSAIEKSDPPDHRPDPTGNSASIWKLNKPIYETHSAYGHLAARPKRTAGSAVEKDRICHALKAATSKQGGMDATMQPVGALSLWRGAPKGGAAAPKPRALAIEIWLEMLMVRNL